MTENHECLHDADHSPLYLGSQVGERHLVFLKSKLETRSGDEVISVHVTTVPFKLASSALHTIRNLLPSDGGVDLQHLRRFTKYQDVLEHVRSRYWMATTKSDIPKGFLILAPTSVVTQKFLSEALYPTLGRLSFFTIEVPLLAPTSQEQASRWTSRYWPTVYKRSNPFGPHPSIISRAEMEIQNDVSKWMNLATEVGRQSQMTGAGEPFGVVIVERFDGIARPVALAGDARWIDWPKEGPGNVTAHAVLRAIDIVAQQVRRSYQQIGDQSDEQAKIDPGIFRGQPRLAIEQQNYGLSPNKDGYLCHDLEIYCTHEPCVMCTMAIVHSRFGRVIFKHRMNDTGGLCADSDLGHGLFWRKELNWQLLAWQWCRSLPKNDTSHHPGSFNVKEPGDDVFTPLDMNV